MESSEHDVDLEQAQTPLADHREKGQLDRTPEERYAALIGELLNYPNVTPPPDGPQVKKKFGSTGLRVQNKIFAMLVKDRLVLKLPKARVNSLTASGDGEPFESGPGRVMKEWLTLAPTSQHEWLDLAKEAMEFVAAKG